jgi:hypothetical protein
MPGMKRLHILLNGPANEASALARLLARGQRVGDSAPGPTSALSRLFDLDEAALAPLLLAAEGIEPGDGQWFRADPVHLLAGMHSLSLLDSRRFSLDASEVEAMIGALNTHFAGEAEFLAPHPLRWYARLQSPLQVQTPPLDQVAGGTIDPRQIAGPDAARLQGLAMEIQMLLHALPVNDTREERGELPINSVWFWGGGERRAASAEFSQVLTRSFTGAALARAADIACCPPDARLEVMPGTILMELEPSTDAALFQAALDALQRGRLDEVVIEPMAFGQSTVRITPWSAWKIWLN